MAGAERSEAPVFWHAKTGRINVRTPSGVRAHTLALQRTRWRCSAHVGVLAHRLASSTAEHVGPVVPAPKKVTALFGWLGLSEAKPRSSCRRTLKSTEKLIRPSAALHGYPTTNDFRPAPSTGMLNIEPFAWSDIEQSSVRGGGIS